jgi:ATP-dependent RNA helicase RhlE
MGHTAVAIHSNRSLAQRQAALAGFKTGRYRVLVATDSTARGIDVTDISLVVNYDLPDNSEDYVHRIGRTGRAGSVGKAVSFAGPDERMSIKQIERLIKKIIPIVPLPVLPPRRIASPGYQVIRSSEQYRTGRPMQRNNFGSRGSIPARPSRGGAGGMRRRY